MGSSLNLPIMKRHSVFSTAFATASLLLLSSCQDGGKKDGNVPENAPQVPAASVYPAIGTDAVQNAVLEKLDVGAVASFRDCTVPVGDASSPAYEADVVVNLVLADDVFAEQPAPAFLNDDRKAINVLANRAMTPESVYMLQVGAPEDLITEEQRKNCPLPENLATLCDELKQLSESPVYVAAGKKGDTVSLVAHVSGVYDEVSKKWNVTDVTLPEEKLAALRGLVPVTERKEGVRELTPEVQEELRTTLQGKVAAFSAAAEEYIRGREARARETWVAEQARREEQSLAAAAAAAELEAQRAAARKTCEEALTAGNVFNGEWRRGNRFGELSIQVDGAKLMDDAVQFYGKLYDTKLPVAKMDIEGRCSLSKSDQGYPIDITIYDGRYDPDQPTAEVFDSATGDGSLILHLTPEGKISGIMTCTSWKDTPEKNFTISFSRGSKEENPKNGKSSKNSRRR